MGALESNTTNVYGVHLRESANDGSDFSNAASDYRVLFLGEDGQLHVKDSAGTVTDIGAGSGAPTDAEYVVGAANGSLSAEIVKAYLGDNLDPDAYPASPDTVDDEFEGGGAIDAKWTKTNDQADPDEFNQTDYSGFLTFGLPENGGTDNFDALQRLSQTPPTGTATMRFRAKVALTVDNLAAEHSEFATVGVYLGNSANDEMVEAQLLVNNAGIASAVALFGVSGGDGATGAMTTTHTQYTIAPGAWVYLELRKTTANAYTSANTYEAWASMNGITYMQVGTISKTFTALCDEVGVYGRRPKSQTGTGHAVALVDFFRKTA